MSLIPSLLAGNRAFRRIWSAGLLSDTGSEVSRIGLLLYVFETRGAVADLALLVVLKTLPAVLFAPFLGVLADRLNRGHLMIAADLARAIFVLVILADPSVSTIYIMAVLDSLAGALFEPARAAAVPQVVSHADVLQANAVARGASNMTTIVGPALGAELYLRAGLSVTLLIDAASFVASAALIAAAGVRALGRGIPAGDAPGADGGVRAGWSYLVGHVVAFQIVVLFFVSMLCGGLWVPLAPFFIRDFLGGSERVLGWQLAAFGLGGLLGGLLALRLDKRMRTGSLLFAALVGEGVQIALYALVPNVAVSLLVLVLWGVSVALIATTSTTILQRQVAERYLGRVFSVVRQGESLAMLLAMGVAIALGAVVASQTIFLAAGVVYCLAVAAVSLTKRGHALRLTA